MVGNFKPWYKSVIVWSGVVQTIIGGLQLVELYLRAGDFSPVALVVLITGILTVVRRIWFSDTNLY